MPELPSIPYAKVEAAAGGFAAKPLADTAEAHAAFQRSVSEFRWSQSDWEVFTAHSGRFEAWDLVLFVPADD